MKKRNQRALWCLLSAMGFSILAGGSVMAAEDGEIRDKITIPYEQENAWDKVAMINDDAVDTGVNIRATADKDGEVVGYLYYGMAAWVIDKGDEWTEITSGDITGFVKNDYLLYGRDVIGLADHYGYEGVATTWDDVKLFSAENADSDVMDVLETGAYFILLQDEGHWLTVQVGTDGLGYVSSEDVSKVLILDTAVDKDELYEGNDLVPMNRGILVTAYASLTKDVTYDEVRSIYDKYYKNEYFIRVLDKDVCPETRWVEGSNFVDVSFKIDPRTNRIIMMGAIDNLVKGAAGQAVQNMNLLFGLPENTGLTMPPVFP